MNLKANFHSCLPIIRNKTVLCANFFSTLGRTIGAIALVYITTCPIVYFTLRKDVVKARKYQKLHNYYVQKALTSFKAWRIFQEYLINYAMNSEKPPSLLHPLYREKEQKKYFEKASLRNGPTIFIDPKKLEIEKKKTGICLGASLKFINDFKKVRARGISNESPFRETAKKHSEGVNEKVALKHSFQALIDSRITTGGFDHERKMDTMAFLFNLRVIGKSQETTKNQINPFLDQLAQGAYEVSLFPESRGEKKVTGHSIALIKTSSDLYIYDSNYGSAKVPIYKQKSVIKRLLGCYKYEKLRFYPIEAFTKV